MSKGMYDSSNTVKAIVPEKWEPTAPKLACKYSQYTLHVMNREQHT